MSLRPATFIVVFANEEDTRAGASTSCAMESHARGRTHPLSSWRRRRLVTPLCDDDDESIVAR